MAWGDIPAGLVFMAVCRECEWNGRKRSTDHAGDAAEDGARHHYRTFHTYTVLQATAGTGTNSPGWRVSVFV